jgi:hypothetical protein
VPNWRYGKKCPKDYLKVHYRITSQQLRRTPNQPQKSEIRVVGACQFFALTLAHVPSLGFA